MQIEIPQELADRIASRFSGVSVEEYVVRAIRESIDEASSGSGVPWWEAELTGFDQTDTDDVSMWQDAQIEAWSRAA